MWHVYILKLDDNTLYTGYTNDLTRRLQEHRYGVGSKYVRGRRPFQSVYVEKFTERKDATKREAYLKKKDRCYKDKLISKSAPYPGS
jgi:putative endonuclease